MITGIFGSAMSQEQGKEMFAEHVSAAIFRCLEDMDAAGQERKRRSGGGSGIASVPVQAPTPEGMEKALESSINQALGKADGDFLAGLLDARGPDDPALRDYGERYRYLDVLGEGGQGKVLRFRDTVLDRDVAIKVVKPPHTTDREKLLENEARLGGMLEHPNILPTYDLCRDETGSPFFVMKKVEGVSLDELLRKAHGGNGDRGEYSRIRILNLFLQVCNAMQYAHSRGVCHLDLKPQNVKLGPFGEVYVLDWGFAARTEDSPKLVAGTPLYIAPERFKPGKPDARCDVYSLGVMLYRILVNQLPRDVGRTSFKEFRSRIQDFPIIPPRQREPGLPRDLEAIVMKAMSENPDLRYQSVGELAGDLERFLDILPVSAYREPWYGRIVKFTRRHPAPIIAGAVMLIAVVFTAAASIRTRRLAAEAAAASRMAEEAGRKAEEAQTEAVRAERLREELIKRRAQARVPLEKGMDIMDKSKTAVEKERDPAKKLQLLQPAINFFTQALEILEEGEDEMRDAAEAYYRRARAYELARDIGRAADDYRMAYGKDSSYIMARYYLGLIYFNNRDVNSALAEFAAMAATDPGNEFSEVGQAYIEAHTGRDAQALERVDRIEERELAAQGDASPADSWRNPGLYNVWLIRGRVYGNPRGEFHDPEKAIEAYSNFMLYDPDKPAPYTNRGNLHLELRARALAAGDNAAAEKELGLAVADFTQALEVDREFKLAFQHRGFVRFKYQGDIAGGLADIEAAIALDPRYTTAILDRAAIRETQGRYDLAEADYELVRQIEPDHRNIDYRLGILNLYRNKLPEAEAAFDRGMDKVPEGDARGIRHHRRGIIRLLRGNFRGAVEDFDESIRQRGSDRIYPALMRWLALSRLGTPPAAEEFGKQIDADPGKPWLTVVASIYLGDDPFGEEQALALADTPQAVCETGFYLGARAWARGETVNAIAFLKQAVDSGESLHMEYSMAKILLERLTAQKENSDRLPDTVGLPPTIPSMSDLVPPLP